MEETIKIEQFLLCHGCLSTDRQLFYLGEYNKETYLSLLGDHKESLVLGHEYDTKLCWECVAYLEKFKKFQSKLLKAQEGLMSLYHGLNMPSCLSSLTKSQNSSYNLEMEYARPKRNINVIQIEVENIKTEMQTDTPNDIPDVKSEDIEPEEIYPKDEEDKTLSILETSDIDEKPSSDELVQESNNVPDVKDEIVNKKKSKEKNEKKRKKVAEYTAKWRQTYGDYVNCKEIDTAWDNLPNYYDTVFLNEREMETSIFVRERTYISNGYTKCCFSCAKCKLIYKYTIDLKRHNNLNHGEPGTYRCSHCKKVLPSHEKLDSHWREHSAMAKCKLCGLILRIRGVKQHLNLAHAKEYNCKFCNMTFKAMKEFGKHCRREHLNFVCDYCQKKYKSKSKLAGHIRSLHTKIHCKECNIDLRNKHQYKQHCHFKHPKLLNKEEPSELRFCVECDKHFPSVMSYNKHIRDSVKHTLQKRKENIPCPECGKIFARKLYMKNHYNLYHLKKTKNHCQLCDKYFATAFGLRMHNANVHEKVEKTRDKICDLCGKAFAHNTTMLNHRRTHTGERPHKCPYCTAEFIQKYAMKTHIKSQHKNVTF